MYNFFKYFCFMYLHVHFDNYGYTEMVIKISANQNFQTNLVDT